MAINISFKGMIINKPGLYGITKEQKVRMHLANFLHKLGVRWR